MSLSTRSPQVSGRGCGPGAPDDPAPDDPAPDDPAPDGAPEPAVADGEPAAITVSAGGGVPEPVDRPEATADAREDRGADPDQPGPSGHRAGRGGRWIAARGLDLAAVMVLMVALLAPDLLGRTRPGDLLRIPLEGILVAAPVLVLPRRAGRVLAVVFGLGLSLVNLTKVLDTGFHFAFARSFDPTVDWTFLADGVDFLSTSLAGWVAIAAVVGVAVLVPLGIVVVTLSAVRMSNLAVRHRPTAGALVATLATIWALSAALHVELVPHRPLAARSVLSLIHQHSRQVQVSLQDHRTLAAEAAVDRFRGVPGDQLLTGLRGKDVVLVFVESYGRSAVQDPRIAPRITATLDDGTRKLAAAGFEARSGWLTSPTYGGGSWFTHSTLLSGLWVNTQGRYQQLISTDRLTLNKAFRSAGWRTVGVEPAIRKAWPEGGFYGYDQVYNFRNLGYRGPRFGYAPMTDQYVLSTFHRRELAAEHRPVMGEIVLVSSHTPWAPLPRMVDWDDVGDGSIFLPMPAQGQTRGESWQSADGVRDAYRRSIQYSLDVLITYLQAHADKDTVLVFLGDHQPSSVVTTDRYGRDVPITIVARDPAVLDRVSGWGWTPGLRPAPQAPVWPMNAFRDRFLTAFGPQQEETR